MKNIMRNVLFSFIAFSLISCGAEDKKLEPSNQPPVVTKEKAEKHAEVKPSVKAPLPSDLVVKNTDSLDKGAEATKQKSDKSYILEIALFISIISLLLVSLALMATIKWRKVGKDQMISLVPSELLKDFSKMHSSQVTSSKQLIKFFESISEQLDVNSHSVSILKSELDKKNLEIGFLKGLIDNSEKEKFSKAVSSTHSLIAKFESSVNGGEVSSAVAFDFLKGSIEDLFEEMGIRLVSPRSGEVINKLPIDSYTIKSVELTSDLKLSNTIKTVIEPGYLKDMPGGEFKVLKQAVLVIYKFES